MSRIRSLHPGQWTDESFLKCSPLARLLALGLRNEADDQGIFEWKPVTLKVKLIPLDNIEIDVLLQELVDSDQIKQFQDAGKLYGAIRNFLKYQRPKHAKAVYPLPAGLRSFVGIFDMVNAAQQNASEPGLISEMDYTETPFDDVSEFPQTGEIPVQMKEEGGKRKEEEEKKIRRKRVSYPDDFEASWKAYPTDNLMSKKEAFDAWKKLDADDRVACHESIPAFVAYCKSHPDYRPIHFVRYISKRRFDGMLEAGRKITERQKDFRVFVSADSPQWDAWDKHLRATTGRGALKSERTGGWMFPTEWPPKVRQVETA